MPKVRVVKASADNKRIEIRLVDAAVAYTRISTENQYDGWGLEAQERAVRDYCEKNGIECVKVFKEQISGATEFEHRDEYKAMVDYCTEQGIGRIIVAKLDRVARDIMVQESIIKQVMGMGVELISVCEPDLCSTDHTRKMIRQMLGVLAEWERGTITYRMRGGRIERAHRGERATGSLALGYRTEKVNGRKQTVVDADEAAIVQRIHQMYKDGTSMRRIADTLNDEDVKTKRGGKWHASTVKYILDNSTYQGIVTYNVGGASAITSTNELLRVVGA